MCLPKEHDLRISRIWFLSFRGQAYFKHVTVWDKGHGLSVRGLSREAVRRQRRRSSKPQTADRKEAEWGGSAQQLASYRLTQAALCDPHPGTPRTSAAAAPLILKSSIIIGNVLFAFFTSKEIKCEFYKKNVIMILAKAFHHEEHLAIKSFCWCFLDEATF